MFKRTVVPVLAATRLRTTLEQGWQLIYETSSAKEEEERREQMKSVGRGNEFDAIYDVNGYRSNVTNVLDRARASPYPSYIWPGYGVSPGV